MMSKKQWFVLLCLFIIYLLLGASFFFQLESREEKKRRIVEKIERKEIEALLKLHYIPSIEQSQEDIFAKLTTYCGKPIHFNMSHTEEPHQWDFYHSLFFVITVVSTIGYGNLAPTTMLGRIFMIFYGVVGIPINGIVMVTLGEFFGKKFTNVYNRWKTDKMQADAARMSLIAQVILYLVPGFTLLIFIPSVIIMIFEGWDYDVAVYYAFVTLTTIGFGDYVAGVHDNQFGAVLFTTYQIFLLVWIIIGLGYVVMVLGFISRGMRSKKMHSLEQILANNIRRTPNKLRELKTLVHELLLLKVKPVYKKKSICIPNHILYKSQSCPDFTIYDNLNSPRVMRKRAMSEALHQEDLILQRIQSDTDLTLIDRDLTFSKTDRDEQHTKLLLKVSNVLSNYETIHSTNSYKGIDCFSSREILQSERYPSNCTIGSQISKRPEVKINDEKNYDNNVTWYGESASLKKQEMRERMRYGRARSRTLPVQQEPLIQLPETGFLGRLKKTFKRDDNSREKDIEKQEMCTPRPFKRNRAASECQNYLDNTRHGRRSLFTGDEESNLQAFAELLIELTTADKKPKRKLGTASLTPPDPSPPRTRRPGIRTVTSRRSSMIPTTPTISQLRRLSLSPEERKSPPPPYSPPEVRPRRFSLRPVTNITTTPSPVQKRMRTTIREGEPMD